MIFCGGIFLNTSGKYFIENGGNVYNDMFELIAAPEKSVGMYLIGREMGDAIESSKKYTVTFHETYYILKTGNDSFTLNVDWLDKSKVKDRDENFAYYKFGSSPFNIYKVPVNRFGTWTMLPRKWKYRLWYIYDGTLDLFVQDVTFRVCLIMVDLLRTDTSWYKQKFKNKSTGTKKIVRNGGIFDGLVEI